MGRAGQAVTQQTGLALAASVARIIAKEMDDGEQ
jgi:hypothetical protein